MAGLIRFVVAILALTWAAAAPAPALAQDERILRFASQIQVRPDAGLEVTETITVVSAGREIKRGIVRDFPTTYRDRSGRVARVDFTVEKVLRDGRPEPWHTESAANGVKVYIGDKDVFIPPGRHTYAITYRSDRQIGYFADYDELYWNVTGNGWAFTIDQAEALILLPPGGRVVQSAAYTGPAGARGQDFVASRPSPESIVFATTAPLPPGAGLTVAVAWPKGLVAQPPVLMAALSDWGAAIAALAGLALLMAYYVYAWFKVGRDPDAGAVAPLFSPPAGLSPAAMRYIWRMGWDQKALSADLVDMAVRGCLTIVEDEGVFSLVRRSNASENALPPEERQLAAKLFAGKAASLKLTNRNHAVFGAAQQALRQALEKAHLRVHFAQNRAWFAPGVVITLMALLLVAYAAPDTAQAGGLLVWVTVWTGACVFLAWRVRLAWRALIHGGGSWLGRAAGALAPSVVALLFGAPLLLGYYLLYDAMGWVAAAAYLGLLLGNWIFFRLLRAPTRLGRKLLDQIEGFRLYLSVAERERLRQLHPPEMTMEHFERCLPYAMALDVEQEWGERFSRELAEAGRDQAEYHPAWYSGRAYSHGGLGGFAANLGGGFGGAIAASSTAPGSSSGSGGGGSSGGGGGGGGGGGW